MAESPAEFDLALAEHHFLNELFAKIDKAIVENNTPRGEMVVLIDELKTHVLQHFAHEENEGLFKQIVSKAPRLEPEAAILRQQHNDLAAALDGISDQLTTESPQSAIPVGLKADFHDFAAQFMEHEEGENRLLQEAYDRDVGSKE